MCSTGTATLVRVLHIGISADGWAYSRNAYCGRAQHAGNRVMPGTRSVAGNIRELEEVRKHPSESSVPAQAAKRTHKQDIAIAFSQARKAGADVKKPRRWTA